MKPYRIEVIDRAYAAILAARTPAERVAMLVDCNLSARSILAAGTRLRHRDWTEQQVAQAVSERLTDGTN